MATNRKKIREQVQILYSQFLDKNGFNDNIDYRVVDLHVEQSINSLLKTQVLQNFKNGSIEVPTSNLIAYTLPVNSNKVTLPVFPIDLKLGMGVWSVTLSDGSYAIPIPNGYQTLLGNTIAGGLEGQVGYVVAREQISFLSNIAGNVVVEVLVSDFSHTNETDMLPISPDMELDVIKMVLSIVSEGRFSQDELNSKTQKLNEN